MGRKTAVYIYFKPETDKISLEKTLTWLRKENFKRETKSPQISVPNNNIRTTI